MLDLQFHDITTDKLSTGLPEEKDIEVSVLRADKIHPVISGNKWFKLKFYLQEAIALNKKTIITFGGAWSNHIIATAAACKLNKLGAIGIIRGEEAANLSPTLVQAKDLGMQLFFICRDDYRQKKIPPTLQNPGYYFINEGGYGIKGAEGAAILLDHCDKKNYTHICCAAGSGTMMAGLIKGTLPIQQVIGISVLKNNMSLEKEVGSLLDDDQKSFHIVHNYHFGGYAKHTKELIDFMNDWYRQTNIPSDFVYTGKLFYAVADLVKNNFFPAGSKLLLIHSGGLQGNASLIKGTLIF